MSDGPNEPEDESLDGPRPLPPFAPSEVEPLVASSDTAVINRKAVWSAVVGLAGLAVILFPFIVAVLLGVVAITSGIHARREIRASRGDQGGDSIALTGIALGVLTLLKLVFLIVVGSALR